MRYRAFTNSHLRNICLPLGVASLCLEKKRQLKMGGGRRSHVPGNMFWSTLTAFMRGREKCKRTRCTGRMRMHVHAVHGKCVSVLRTTLDRGDSASMARFTVDQYIWDNKQTNKIQEKSIERDSNRTTSSGGSALDTLNLCTASTRPVAPVCVCICVWMEWNELRSPGDLPLPHSSDLETQSFHDIVAKIPTRHLFVVFSSTQKKAKREKQKQKINPNIITVQFSNSSAQRLPTTRPLPAHFRSSNSGVSTRKNKKIISPKQTATIRTCF